MTKKYTLLALTAMLPLVLSGCQLTDISVAKRILVMPMWQGLLLVVTMLLLALVTVYYSKYCGEHSDKPYNPYDLINQVAGILSGLILFSWFNWGVVLGIIAAVFLFVRNYLNMRKILPCVLLTLLNIVSALGLFILLIVNLLLKLFKKK